MLIFFDYPKSSWNIYINGTMQTARFSLDKDSAMLYLQHNARCASNQCFTIRSLRRFFSFFFLLFRGIDARKRGNARGRKERERERDESRRVVAPVSGHEIMKKKTEFGGRDLM